MNHLYDGVSPDTACGLPRSICPMVTPIDRVNFNSICPVCVQKQHQAIQNNIEGELPPNFLRTLYG